MENSTQKIRKIQFIFSFAKKMLTIFDWNFEVWAVQKCANLVDLVKSFATSIYLQKPASIQPRTSLSKFGGKFNSFFIRHLAGKRTERRLRGALERGPRLGGCRDRSGLASSHQTWSVMIRKKSTISWIRNLSFLVSSWQAKTEAKCFLLFGLKTMRPLSLGAGIGCIEASLLKLELGNFCNIWQFCLGGLVLGWSKAKFCTKKRLTTFFKIYKICILLHRCNLKILATSIWKMIMDLLPNTAREGL